MVITEIFDKLKSLQVILGRKYELEQLIEEAPKQLTSQEELLARMKKEYIEKNRDYEIVKERVGNIKLDLETAIKTREAGEKNMDNITTHREYEALEKQISEASVKESELRKELQKEDKILAELDDTLKTTEAMISSQESDLTSSKDSLNSQIESYKSELADLKSQEEGITPGLNQEVLFKFQRIIQRNSEGIVAVKNGVCTGCHMILPAQFANEVREGENILFCPYCSRILFYEESDESEQETFFNDAGSLADFESEIADDDEYDSDEYEEDSENSDLYDDSDDLSDEEDDDIVESDDSEN